MPKAAGAQVPGSFFKKNPFIVNTSTHVGNNSSSSSNQNSGYGYAGMKLQFQKMSPSGEYVSMKKEEVDLLFQCYYIGNVDSDSDLPNSDTAAGWGGSGTTKQLGEGWVQVTGDGYASSNYITDANGVMYFVYNKELAPLGETVFSKSDTGRDGISPAFNELTENESDDTWGYTTGSTQAETGSYATTTLFQGIRYADKTNQLKIDELKTMLNKTDDGDTAVTDAGQIPGWRILISSALVDNSVSPFNAAGAVDTSSGSWGTLKEAIDASATEKKGTGSTGLRHSSTLGKYIQYNPGTNTATVIDGNGVAEYTE